MACSRLCLRQELRLTACLALHLGVECNCLHTLSLRRSTVLSVHVSTPELQQLDLSGGLLTA